MVGGSGVGVFNLVMFVGVRGIGTVTELILVPLMCSAYLALLLR